MKQLHVDLLPSFHIVIHEITINLIIVSIDKFISE